MIRREFIQRTGAAAAAMAIGAPAIIAQPQPDVPNVLFIVFDDLNDWISCLGGHPQGESPNIDALADSGVLFSNAHVNCTICVPSRASMFSGMRPSSLGIYDNAGIWRDRVSENIMMPWTFQNAGYHVYRTGKFHHPKEFAVWEDELMMDSQVRPPNFPANKASIRPTYFPRLDWGVVDMPVRVTRDHKFTNWAAEKLHVGASEPFFLAVGYKGTHDPWYVPREFAEKYPLDSIELPDVPEDELDDIPPYPQNYMMQQYWFREVKLHQQWRKAVQAYLATIAAVDYQVGRLMNELEDSGHADDTIVVFTSDHALHLGEKYNWGKHCAWREDSHVPLIWRVPWITPSGAVNNHATEVLDIYPTLNDLCDMPVHEDCEGQSIRPQLEDPSLPLNRPAIITPRYEVHAIKDDQYRLIYYNNQQMELYDNINDPREHTNLIDDPAYQDVINDLLTWIPDVNVEP